MTEPELKAVLVVMAATGIGGMVGALATYAHYKLTLARHRLVIVSLLLEATKLATTCCSSDSVIKCDRCQRIAEANAIIKEG